ncbi:sirohydrochlorin cobaltochelatase [Eubacterium multiforme]|uniref:Sirohydrochlorin cobaltochelatase n=1 Tax=Eubacterium multiforme TaxID=83339 RepID=A0ABT9UTG3_9FIRM|nr:sirohydrochlorin cobaltochelatase [Eubacterium multiforme]MDQ0149597.1 sirohydrochlorin cobaltochelatase [Eubacterium multiforme]
MNNKAIVIVAFGTGKEEDFNKYLLPFKKDAKDKYGEDFDIFISLTSEKMIEKLNLGINNYEDTLKKLSSLKYEEVYVEALYFSRGKEYSKIESITEKYKDFFKRIKVTKPVFEENEDLIDEYFKSYNNIIFICHGIHGSKKSIEEDYIKKAMQKNSKEQNYVALINKKDNYKNLVKTIKGDKIPKVTIIPILITKGYHFNNDVISDSSDSLTYLLKEEGITVEIVDKVLAENNFFRKLILEDLNKIIN